MAKKTGLWIPDEIINDTRLTALEMLILSTIMALAEKEGCYASNQYLANKFRCTTDKIYRAIAKGRKYGYFDVNGSARCGRIITLESGQITDNSGYITEKDGQITEISRSNNRDKSVKQPSLNDSFLLYKENIVENIVREDTPPPQSVREEFPPGLDTVRAYAQEIGAVTEPERFCNYYGSTGWMRGKTPIQDWRALFREWDREDRAKSAPPPPSNGGIKNNYIERKDAEIDDMWEAALRRAYGDLMD